MYRFLLWLVPTVEKFPRSQKFLLGDRHPGHRARRFGAADRGDLHEGARPDARRGQPRDRGERSFRLLFRLSRDLKFLDMRRYEHAARSLDEIGRLIGGWRKASDAAPA